MTTTNVTRGKWSSPREFLLTCIGYSVGLGNVWRFPYLCYKNGGGAFLIAYIVMISLIGMPMLLMEFSFGQYFGIGSLSIFKQVCPIFQGIGVGYIILNALISIYYNVIIAMSLYYIFGSFATHLPWSSCENEWNTDACAVDRSIPLVGNSTFLPLVTNQSDICNNGTRQRSSPTDEYFRFAVLNEQPGVNIENVGTIQPYLCLCLVLAWVLVILFVSRGIHSTGKVAYFTATFPYAMLTVLVVRGATLEGASQGIRYFFTPKWQELQRPEVWYQAATQLFYSTNLAWGGMITMASYNTFNHNCYRDTLIINVISFFTSLYAGIAVFSIIGFMAHEYQVPVGRVINSGPGLVFIAYPRALSLMPLAQLWTVLFFFMLFLLGIGSQMVCIETVVTGFVDEFPKLGLNKLVRFMTTLSICLVLFASGIVMTTQGGMYVLQLMDHYTAGFGLLFLAVIECIAIGRVYGGNNLAANIQEMMSYYPQCWWRCCWKFITPALLTAILVFTMVKYQPVEYNNLAYPVWADVIGWMFSIAASLPTVIAAIYVIRRTPGQTLLQRLKLASRPKESAFNNNRTSVQFQQNSIELNVEISVESRIGLSIVNHKTSTVAPDLGVVSIKS